MNIFKFMKIFLSILFFKSLLILVFLTKSNFSKNSKFSLNLIAEGSLYLIALIELDIKEKMASFL